MTKKERNKQGATLKAPQNQPKMPKITPEQQAAMDRMEATCDQIMRILEGMLIPEAAISLKTCSDRLQVKIQEHINGLKVESDAKENDPV